MKLRTCGFLALVLAAAGLGCTADVEPTEDSVRLEAEIPQVETGPADVDLDPSTDDDVDIDTPKPGDT